MGRHSPGNGKRTRQQAEKTRPNSRSETDSATARSAASSAAARWAQFTLSRRRTGRSTRSDLLSKRAQGLLRREEGQPRAFHAPPEGVPPVLHRRHRKVRRAARADARRAEAAEPRARGGVQARAPLRRLAVPKSYDMSGFKKVIAKPVTSEKLRHLFL